MKEKRMVQMSTQWFLIIIVFLFGIGIILGVQAGATPQVITKEVPKEVCTREDTWKQLKAVDDKAFQSSSEGFYLASDAFKAVSVFDFNQVNLISAKMNAKADEMAGEINERQSILHQLGY